MKRLSWQQMAARAEAYREASGHLLLNWTDDPHEITQGNFVSDELQRKADTFQFKSDKEKQITEACIHAASHQPI